MKGSRGMLVHDTHASQQSLPFLLETNMELERAHPSHKNDLKFERAYPTLHAKMILNSNEPTRPSTQK